eukprot:g105.t1
MRMNAPDSRGRKIYSFKGKKCNKGKESKFKDGKGKKGTLKEGTKQNEDMTERRKRHRQGRKKMGQPLERKNHVTTLLIPEPVDSVRRQTKSESCWTPKAEQYTIKAFERIFDFRLSTDPSQQRVCDVSHESQKGGNGISLTVDIQVFVYLLRFSIIIRLDGYWSLTPVARVHRFFDTERKECRSLVVSIMMFGCYCLGNPLVSDNAIQSL